ncbi:MAG: hypothetical protein ABIF71_13810 [Planctomycetota bacterium]
MRQAWIAFLALLLTGGWTLAQELTVEGDNQGAQNLQKAVEEMDKVTQMNKSYARNYLEIGKTQYAAYRLEESKENLKLALRYDPEMQEAADLLDKVMGLLGERPSKVRSMYDWALQEHKVKVQQRKMEMENLVDQGRALNAKGEYADAADKFEAALQIHRWMPYSMEFPELKKEAQSGYDDAKKKADDEAINDRKRRQEKAQNEAIIRLRKEQELEERRIQGLFDRMKNAYYNKSDFDLAEKLADEILNIDPNNKLAWEWKWEAKAKRHNQKRSIIRQQDKEEVESLNEYLDESMIPQTALIQYPKGWLDRVKGRSAPGIGMANDPEWKMKIIDLMEKKVSFDFLETPLEQVVQFLSRVTGITIVLDPAALVDDMGTPVPKNVTLRVDNMRFSSALNWILRLTDLKMSLRDEAIFIGKNIDTEAALRIYDVRDLTVQPQDMPGPNIELVSGEADISISSFDEGADTIDAQAISELIQGSVAPEIWTQQDTRVGIEVSGGKLVVTAPDRVHELIQQLLDNFRQQNVLQVNVYCRFLTVADNFADDIGVSIRNWNTRDQEIPGVGNIFTPNGTGTIPTATDAFANPSHPAMSANGALSQFEVYPVSPAGWPAWDQGFVGVNTNFYNRLITDNPVGQLNTGLWFDYHVDGGVTADFTLHAVEATQTGRTLAAPRLTVFNNQRAHIMVVTQHAYVRDVTPVVAEASTSFDPEIDTYTTGTVLDIRPTVSSDRKYITLEVRPTRAELHVQPVRGYTVTGAAYNVQSTAIIEMPEITIHRVRTNAVIPDGGSIILGGMNSVWKQHMRQGIPFLSHIPFLGRLFSRDVTSDQKETLLIMITCNITLFQELEAEL